VSVDTLGARFQIKTVDFGQRIISGWAAYHGNVDRVADIIDPAASQKAVRRLKSPSDVGVFIGHDMGRLPVGVPVKIEAHPEGLYTETRVFEGPTGDDLLGAARGLRDAGQSLGLSIGYRVHDAKPDRVNGKAIRRLLDYSLHEYSFASSVAIANPAALVTGVKTSGGSMRYTVEKAGDKWAVMKDGAAVGDPCDSEDEAKARCAKLNAEGGKTVPNRLPDSAFLYVQPGGVLDDEGKTVPRSYRHFPIRDADGGIDADALRAALPQIADAKTVGLDADDAGRLSARARRMLDQIERGNPVTDEPAEWKTGAAVDLLTVAYRLIDAAEAIAAEQQHRRALGEDTKSGWRMRSESADAVNSILGQLGRTVEHLELVAAGKDEEALADWWRAQFELIGVSA